MTESQIEAARLMTVCNSCRYCEGLCAVFPAMEERTEFLAADVNYLANLCHSCGACYVDCQFSPPHEFNVNVPQVLAQVRAESYAQYTTPAFLAPIFAKNGLYISLILTFSVAGFIAYVAKGAMFENHMGQFYKLMPHNTMVVLFGGAFLYGVTMLALSVRKFWAESGGRVTMQAFIQGTRDAATLKYLDGGGVGCYNEDEKPTDNRKFYHHLTFYGFALCFASTSFATLYHYLLGLQAPYPWYDVPVVLGTIGGLGLVIGPVGLFMAKLKRDKALEINHSMETAFLAMLFATGLTGLLLLVLRSTPLMGTMLAVHLGTVFAFFITMPYGKFVHGFYRWLALVRYAIELNGEKK